MSKSTTGAQRRFLNGDLARLEHALHDAWVTVSGDSPLLKPSITTCWTVVSDTVQDESGKVLNAIVSVLKIRQAIWDGDEIEQAQLDLAVRRIDFVVDFLHWRFPKA